MKNLIGFFIFYISLFSAGPVKAQNESFQKTKIGIYYALFSGEKNKSFSNGSSAVGFEGSMESQGDILTFYSRGRFLSSVGRQTFLDGTTEITSSYTFYQTQIELGGHLFLIPRRKKTINIYLGAAGSLGFSHLVLSSSSATLELLKKVDQSQTTGFSGHVGIEWMLDNQTTKKWTLSSEIGYSSENANLGGTSQFKLNSFFISGGLGW